MTRPGPLPTVVHLVPDARHYKRWVGAQPRRIRKIVLHSTEGTDSRAWLSTSPASAVSIHVLIARDGTRVNIVNYGDVANHVGYAIPPYNNVTCIGVEFENSSNTRGRIQAYPAAQIATGAHWVATILYSYGLSWADVVRHGDIANRPVGRRSDPVGPFPLAALHTHTAAWLAYWQTCSEAERQATII